MSAETTPSAKVDLGRDDVLCDLAFPSIPWPSPEFLAAIGEATLHALVKCHHERLRKSSIGPLFPADPKRFDAVVERIGNAIVATVQGASRIAESNGHIWLRAQHFPLAIDESARNVWLAEMLGAFDDVGFPDGARLEYWNWVEALSIVVINRRTMISQPRRYPFAGARETLSPFMRQS
jgi:hemoglobin